MSALVLERCFFCWSAGEVMARSNFQAGAPDGTRWVTCPECNGEGTKPPVADDSDEYGPTE